MQKLIIDCGHNNPTVTRTFNAGNGEKSIFSLCINCKEKQCFNEFVIKEVKKWPQ